MPPSQHRPSLALLRALQHCHHCWDPTKALSLHPGNIHLLRAGGELSLPAPERLLPSNTELHLLGGCNPKSVSTSPFCSLPFHVGAVLGWSLFLEGVPHPPNITSSPSLSCRRRKSLVSAQKSPCRRPRATDHLEEHLHPNQWLHQWYSKVPALLPSPALLLQSPVLQPFPKDRLPTFGMILLQTKANFSLLTPSMLLWGWVLTQNLAATCGPPTVPQLDLYPVCGTGEQDRSLLPSWRRGAEMQGSRRLG